MASLGLLVKKRETSGTRAKTDIFCILPSFLNFLFKIMIERKEAIFYNFHLPKGFQSLFLK